MKNITNLCFILLVFAVSSCTSFMKEKTDGTVFYVPADGDDNNQGNSSKPFKTIQKAVDAIIGKEVNTILLKEGIYWLEAPLVINPKHVEIKN